MVQLEGYSKVQRACTPCVANATKAMEATDRLFLLAERLERVADTGALVTPPTPTKPVEVIALEGCEETTGDRVAEGAPADQARGRRLEDAVERCEAAATPLEALRARLVEAEARAARAERETQDLAKCPAGEQRAEPEVPDCTNSASVPDARGEAAPTVRGRQDWQENTLACGLCATAFTPFKRRHHCRLCGLCVCITCSPGTVQIEGHQQLQRACNRCVAQQQTSSDAQQPASEQTLAC